MCRAGTYAARKLHAARQDYRQGIKLAHICYDCTHSYHSSISNVQDVVAEFDTSGDGVLDRDELLAALIRLDGGTMSVYQATQLMNWLDASGDGSIDVQELDAAMRLFRRRRKQRQLHLLLPPNDSEDNIDSVYPNWLVKRTDFQTVFTRFNDPFDDKKLSLDEAAEVALRLTPSERSDENIHQLSRWFQAKSDFARQLNDKTRYKMSSYLTLRELAPQEYVFQEGDEGDAFYIVFSGEVAVVQGVDKRIVARIGPGSPFGQTALQSDQPRNAGIAATENGSKLVRLSKIHYNLILKNQEKLLIKEARTFFREVCPLSRNWPLSRTDNLAQQVLWIYLDQRKHVFREGDDTGGLYFLVSGECSACRTLKYSTNNSWPTVDRSGKSKRRSRPCKQFIDVKLRKLLPGDCFGEDWLMPDVDKRLYDVQVQSPTAVFVVISADRAKYYFDNDVQDMIFRNTEILHKPEQFVKDLYEGSMKRLQYYASLRRSSLGKTYDRRTRTSSRKPKKGNTSSVLEAVAERQKDRTKGRVYSEAIFEAASLGLADPEVYEMCGITDNKPKLDLPGPKRKGPKSIVGRAQSPHRPASFSVDTGEEDYTDLGTLDDGALPPEGRVGVQTSASIETLSILPGISSGTLQQSQSVLGFEESHRSSSGVALRAQARLEASMDSIDKDPFARMSRPVAGGGSGDASYASLGGSVHQSVSQSLPDLHEKSRSMQMAGHMEKDGARMVI